MTDNSIVLIEKISFKLPFMYISDDSLCCELVRDVIDYEIRDFILGMAPNKSLGPDRWSCFFFKDLWGCLGDDLCRAIKYVISTHKILAGLNATHICLIPFIT